ncbi:LOW QUALITY PROTEIN: hypothetical protein CH63R_14466 [Colletotrichum higginsianum IMI 349063]|uniref:Uncharacterized protein n=1 Tax=Colletotrichum higginsianum (strain IMI 349063) TaxID=759273 RepID=A0A1B7XQX4_COLHI|nr:LOW QUALITY PROTEIN: hypothetical protein CH63R_14466 [Colletotrichum higginsianum IMI 349063]OBR02165.1 LOW QUALITY PROTEIN: hypothetical protein CH63R_14466 [Colletotrichum higginsianum IMI 349063]
MGAGAIGRQMVAKTRAAYYGGNKFRLPLDCLQSFLSDSLEDGEMDSINQLIQRELLMLLLFTRAETITIRLCLSRDAADPHLRQRILALAPVVKRLLAHFGDRVRIVQDVLHPSPTAQRCLQSYWDRPTNETRRRVDAAMASLEESIQVAIAGLA